MTIYSCEHELEAMFTCIYVAWASGKGFRNIKLMLEPIEQYTLFDEYIHVDADTTKSNSVADAICNKISPYVYRQLAYYSMAYEEDVLDNMYRILLLGFNYGPNVLSMVQYKEVMRYTEIRKRLSTEACKFKEVVRFHAMGRNNSYDIDDSTDVGDVNRIRSGGISVARMGSLLYVAHIEPKSRLIVTLGPAFEDRMPSEHWMIIDDVHKEAIIHPANEHYYLRQLSDDEYEQLLATEKENDEYTDLWKVFFDSIAIKERENYRCQRTLLPLWYRKHAVEFDDVV